MVGGGPSGAFCAIWLRHLASQAGRQLEVTIFDHKDFEKPGPAGCNMCAGIIPDSLVSNMAALGIALPEHVIQHRIRGYHLATRGGEVDLWLPGEVNLYATFRGPGPLGMYPGAHEGFDWFLLDEARKRGAEVAGKLVTEVVMPKAAEESYRLICRDGDQHEADLVVGAFGVNSNLGAVFEKLGFGYRAPKTIRARQAEIPLDPVFISQQIGERVLLFATGSPGIRFAAITPKRQHVTVTLIGDNPSRAQLEEFLQSAPVKRYLPAGWSTPEHYCSCSPRLPVSAARRPLWDRLLVVGDAHISRYLKNGIESAYYTAMWAAQAICSDQVSRDELARHYLLPCQRAYLVDNYYGRLLLRIHDFVSRSRLITRSHIQVVQDEQRAGKPDALLVQVLLGLFTGNMPYHVLWRKATAARLQAKLAGALLRQLGRSLLARGRNHGADPRVGWASPLGSQHTVIIIGGGPAGASCAISLARLGEQIGHRPRVILLEGKHFGQQQNQCAGVLSPPALDILASLFGGQLPHWLLQRRIKGYVLHGESRAIYLDGEQLGDISDVIRRVEMDQALLEQAAQLGIEVVHTRATDTEIHQDGVVVYTDTGSFQGDAVVGGFSLDEGMARSFSRHARYRPPRALQIIACKVHPAGLEYVPRLLDDCIHVFLPQQPRVDFAALIPKANHITIVAAGPRVGVRDVTEFIDRPEVACLLPPNREVQGYYRGSFPLGPARGLFADRSVVIGDASGLVRPFKGKGINAALEAGVRCAHTLLNLGWSRRAFAHLARGDREIRRDLWYGRLVRLMVQLVARYGLLDVFIERASCNRPLRQVLFDCVSGRVPYRHVVLRRENFGWLPTVLWRCLCEKLRPRRERPRRILP